MNDTVIFVRPAGRLVKSIVVPEVAATGAIASLILTRGSAAQQRAWADMMLHPESAATVRTFSEIATPLVAENVMKGMVAKQAQSAPAKP